jgi:hypothetical protein
MQTIEIQYRPLLFPWKRTIKGSFPETYAELTGNQLCAVAAMVKDTVTETGFLSRMTGIPARIVNRMSQFHRFALFSLFIIFDNIKPHNAFIINQVTCKNKILVSPAAKLKGVTFGQFIFADMLFETYSETKLNADLHRFVAALYLPVNTVFNEDIIDENAALVAAASPEISDAIAINYQLVREWLCNVYPLVFPQADVEQPATSNHQPETSIQKPASRNAWIKIFESLVGDDIVNHAKYGQMPVHNVFRYMSEKIKQNMKRKK